MNKVKKIFSIFRKKPKAKPIEIVLPDLSGLFPDNLNRKQALIDDYEKATIQSSKNRALKHSLLVSITNAKQAQDSENQKRYCSEIVSSVKTIYNQDVSCYNVWNSLFSRQRNMGTAQDPLHNIITAIDYSTYLSSISVYKGLDIMARVIDEPINYALKKPIKVSVGSDSLDDEINEKLEKINYIDILKNMLLYSRISSRGALLVPIYADDYDYSTEQEAQIDTFNVLPDYVFTYLHISHFQDIKDMSFNTPSYYQVNGMSIAKENLYHCIRGYDPITGLGISEIGKNLQAVKALNLLENGFANIALQPELKIIKYKMEEGIAADKTVSSAVSLAKSIMYSYNTNRIAYMPDSMELESKEMKLNTGVQFLTQFLKEFLAMTSGIPTVILDGTAQGQVASAEKNLKQFYDNVKSSEQTAYIVPAMKFMTRKILGSRADNLHITVKLEPIYENTPIEQLDLERKKIENEIAMKDLEEIESLTE